MSKKVELELEDFEKLIKREKDKSKIIETLKAELEKCKKANEFLNNQIKEYNQRFAKDENG